MTTYRERLTAPVGWWVGCGVVGVVCGWIMLVATTRIAAAVTAVVIAALCMFMVARYGSVVIARDTAGLRVGRAFLDAAHLGPAEPLHRADYRRRMSIDADARAYLITRPYLDRGVLVHVQDESDPTPYWLISSRHPDDLAQAINDHTRQEAPRGQEA